MRLGIIIETNEPEKAWNAVRFGNAALKQGHEVKIFLMSAGVEIVSITQKNTTPRHSLKSLQEMTASYWRAEHVCKSRNSG